jgi:hypothetical protein
VSVISRPEVRPEQGQDERLGLLASAHIHQDADCEHEHVLALKTGTRTHGPTRQAPAQVRLPRRHSEV